MRKSKIFVRLEGMIHGPLTASSFQELIKEGAITSTTPVSIDDQIWFQASRLRNVAFGERVKHHPPSLLRGDTVQVRQQPQAERASESGICEPPEFTTTESPSSTDKQDFFELINEQLGAAGWGRSRAVAFGTIFSAGVCVGSLALMILGRRTSQDGRTLQERNRGADSAEASQMTEHGWAGYSTDHCLICGGLRAADSRARYSDRRGYGLCADCGLAYERYKPAFAKAAIALDQNQQMPTSLESDLKAFRDIVLANFRAEDDENRRGLGLVFMTGQWPRVFDVDTGR